MCTVDRYEAQQESARRAFARAFVSGLARRMARTGMLRKLARTVGGKACSLTRFPSMHLRTTTCDNADIQPLRISGVAAGGAGGGGPGARGNVISFPA